MIGTSVIKELNTSQEMKFFIEEFLSTTVFENLLAFTQEVLNGKIIVSVALETLIYRTKTLKLYESF